MKNLVLLIVLFMVIGCGTEDSNDSSVGKSDVASVSGKGDSADLDAMCEELDREPGCDPCSVQEWYGDGNCDEFCPVRDADCGVDQYNISVELDVDLGATMSVIYQSTKDSFGCTDLTVDGVNFRRVPEQIRKEVEAQCEDSMCGFEFPNALGDGCESVIRHIYLEPTDAQHVLEPWASLSFVDGDEEAAQTQVVECYVSEDGRMMCGNDLLYYDGSGAATVALVNRTEE